MTFSVKEIATIAVIAFLAVWLIDKGLNKTGLKSFAINNT